MSAHPVPAPVPFDRRRAVLDQVIAVQVARNGRVVHQTDGWAVIAYGAEPAHAVHAIAALLTCGLWVPVWLLVALTGGEKRRTFSVDEWGQVHVQGWKPELALKR